MIRTRTLNGRTWEYCECEGFWWLRDVNGKLSRHSVRRSDRNVNVWLACDGETVLDEYPTMKKAMQRICCY